MPPRRRAPTIHVRFVLDSGEAVIFHNPRRFGFVDYRAPGILEADPPLSRLGPEPLADGFTPAVLVARLAGRTGPVKTVLLDQTVVAGLGSIYVCEVLFRAGISPLRSAVGIGPRRLARLVAAIKAVLAEAVAVGGSTLRDHRLPDGTEGQFQMRFAVYDRAGEACPSPGCAGKAGHGIKRIVQAGRSTYYCPGYQR